MRYERTSATWACLAGGRSWDQAALELAVLPVLQDLGARAEHREQTQPLEEQTGIGKQSVRRAAKQSGVQGKASVPAGNCGAG